MNHPLISPNAKHYDCKKVPHIKHLEINLSVAAMAGFCEGNISKYKYRLESKGQKESDLEKLKDYSNYFDVIKLLLHKGYKNNTVSFDLQTEGIHYD